MNKCPLCGHDLTIEKGENDMTRVSKKCGNCGFEVVDYATKV
ncbi:hypothetical protein [Geoglobus sp.]